MLVAFQAYWEKNLWIAAYMLVGALHDGCTVGDVEAKHRKEASICRDGFRRWAFGSGCKTILEQVDELIAQLATAWTLGGVCRDSLPEHLSPLWLTCKNLVLPHSLTPQHSVF